MKSVIEIPVITRDNDSFLKMFKSNLVTEQRSYQDFDLVEWQLEVTQSIFFYLIKAESSDQLMNVLKQVVPKAPAVLFMNNEPEDNDLIAYLVEKFDTPLFVFSEIQNEKAIQLPLEISSSIDKITHFILKHIDGLLTTSTFGQEETKE